MDSCQTATQYGSENAIALPSGWSIAVGPPYSSFQGNWGASNLVAWYSSSTSSHIYRITCSAIYDDCSASTSSPYNCAFYDDNYYDDYYYYHDNYYQNNCIEIVSSANGYYIESSSNFGSSGTNNWKILIRRSI